MRMIEPLPQLFSICAIARFSAFFLSSPTIAVAMSSTLVESLRPLWRPRRQRRSSRRRTRIKYENRGANSSWPRDRKRIFHVPDPDAGGAENYPDDVESVRLPRHPGTVDPDPRAPRELPLLPDPDRLHRVPERQPPPRLHLHERDHPRAAGDEVEVPVPAPEAAREHLPPPPLQPPGGHALPEGAELLPVDRHGANLGAAG